VPRFLPPFALPLLAASVTGVVLGAAVPCGAHEFWLAPSSYRAATGDSLAVGAFVGTGFRGEARPWAAHRVRRFFARDAAPLDLARVASGGSSTWARWTARDGEGVLVAQASDFLPIELPAAEFERYLALEGLEAVSRSRAQAGRGATPGRERYRRSSKLWIAGTRGSTARATVALGLPLEIVPLAEPGASGRLSIRVEFEGRPLAGALVRAWRQDLAGRSVPADAAARDSVGPQAEARTDDRGHVTLAVDSAGEWLLGTVHMIPSRDRRAADWESTWGSLTFARP
jgi:uncharacterized GH25 family protein